MKKMIAMVLALVLTLSMAACAQEQTKETAPKKTESTQTEAVMNETSEPVTVKIWHDGDENIMSTIAELVNTKLAEDNITVSFEKKSDTPGQLRLYGNDPVNAPDMYFYAHDVLGSLVAMDLLAPLTDLVDASIWANHLPMTVQAGQINDQQYLLPVYFETLILLYNKDLWEGEIPDTTEALYEYMQAHTDSKAGTYALVNQHTNAYNVSPFVNGFGGFIINAEGTPGFDDPKTIEAAEYNRKFGELQADGDYNTVTTLFNEGKAAGIIGGPWLVSGIEAAGISYGVAPLSDIKLPNGNGLAPFSGVQGVGVLKVAVENKKDAIAKVLTAIADPEIGIALAKKSGCAPANNLSYEDAEVSANPIIAAIQKTASTAQPMPNIPEMGAMWGPAESMFTAINKNGVDPAKAGADAQAAAEQAIADMH